MLNAAISNFPVASLERYIFYAIILSISIAILLFLWTTLSIYFTNREGKIKQEYQKIVDNALFEYLFAEINLHEILNNSIFSKHLNKKLFQRIAIKSIISLNYSYTGEYNEKLNALYKGSTLLKYSYSKLDSSDWANIVEGIRDLSNMDVQEAYPKIEKFLRHKNKMVQTEAIFGMIKLRGIQEIDKIAQSEIYLNDWIQSNIMFIVEEHKLPMPQHLTKLLYSNNYSVAILAIRLIKHYNLKEHKLMLSVYMDNVSDNKIKYELELALKRLGAYNKQL